jgi:hypothetical protein
MQAIYPSGRRPNEQMHVERASVFGPNVKVNLVRGLYEALQLYARSCRDHAASAIYYISMCFKLEVSKKLARS